MNIVMRILLAFYAFCLMVFSLMLMVVTIRPDWFNSFFLYFKESILPSTTSAVLLIFVELIFFGLSLMFLLSGVRNNKEKKSISKFNKVGEVRISLNTIESIALSASRKLNGVKETKAYVTKLGENVSIYIKTVVMADINIPALMEDIQVKVKKSVEETAGILVSEVKVSAENIYTGYKSRVE